MNAVCVMQYYKPHMHCGLYSN